MTSAVVSRLPLVILISGSGSNLQAIMDAIATNRLHADIRAVISNKKGAYGLQRARQQNIHTSVIDHKEFSTRTLFDQSLMKCIDQYQPKLVILAGFMRILTASFVTHYQGRMVNIHPSLLPDHPGLNTHQQALDAGADEHGVSIHFVTNELDGGPVISQAKVPVKPVDTEEDLAQRVLEQEHHLYPRTLELFCLNRLQQQNNRVLLDGKIMDKPLDYTFTMQKNSGTF